MLTCDRVLANAVRKLGDKQSQMSYIANALGPNRVVRAWHDASGTAKYPALTGTEIISLQMDGNLSLAGGSITGLGFTNKVNKFLPNINLATGQAVMRIEGNGHYIQGTLGLLGNFDFSLSANPDPLRGLAFSNASRMNAPVFVPSGTGPKAPDKVRTSPHRIKLYDWSDPRSPVLVKSIPFDNRQPDWVYEDAEMARSTGDAAVWQTENAFWDNFSLGATLVIADPSCTEVGNVPLYQIMVGWKYEASWSTYPRSNTQMRETVVMNPPPYKIVVEDQNGNTMYVWEMHDGSPINDFRLYSGNSHRGGRSATAALQPQFNTMMMLFWQNTRPRRTDFIEKLYPGSLNFRQTMSKSYLSMISVEPLLTGGYGGNSANGLAHMYYSTKWPNVYGPQPITDPYISAGANNVYSALYNAWAQGYGYEPGAFGNHNWYTSPGGPRGDRCVIPTFLAMYLTDPSGYRLQGNVPHRELVDEWFKNSWNHSNHHLTNAASLATIPLDEVIGDEWVLDAAYYGVYPRDKSILMCGDQREGTSQRHYDLEGNMYISGWARDPLHDYHSRGWASMAFCSPAHGIGSKFDTLTSMMLHQNPYKDPTDYYMVRTMAWHWMHLVIAWKNASQHPTLGIPRIKIENHFAKMLEAYYNTFYKRVFIDMDQDPTAVIMRNLGISVDWSNGRWGDKGGRLGFYMAHVLQLMKQTGMWHAMIRRGTVYETVLKNLIENMDRYCFGMITDGRGAATGYQAIGGNNYDVSTIPSDWADWYERNKNEPWAGDFVHRAEWLNGQNRYGPIEYNPNEDVGNSNMVSYARIRRDYFPEIPHPKLQAANDEFDRYEAIVAAKVAAEPVDRNKYDLDYKYRCQGLSPFKGPKPGNLVLA
jgi:hypothetical protein